MHSFQQGVYGYRDGEISLHSLKPAEIPELRQTTPEAVQLEQGILRFEFRMYIQAPI